VLCSRGCDKILRLFLLLVSWFCDFLGFFGMAVLALNLLFCYAGMYLNWKKNPVVIF
jgi:hypothetical protein